MKAIRCDECQNFFQIPDYHEAVKFCECKNVGGRYLIDGECAIIYLKDESCLTKTRIVGVPNEVLLGQQSNATCGRGDYKEDKQLLVLVAGEIYSNAALLETNEPRFFSVLYLLHFLNEVCQNVNWKKHVCETFMQNLSEYQRPNENVKFPEYDSVGENLGENWWENLKRKFRRVYGRKDTD